MTRSPRRNTPLQRGPSLPDAAEIGQTGRIVAGRVARGEPGSLVGTSRPTPQELPMTVARRPTTGCPTPSRARAPSSATSCARRPSAARSPWSPRSWPWCGPTSTTAPTPRSCTGDIGPLDVEHWAADGALALFFFVAGLELKRELLVGSLRRPADAAVPVVAACCGVAVPALIYVTVNLGTDNLEGWAVPAATDIAFALAILAVVGSALPNAAARLPAHAGRRRRPDRDRRDRVLLHLDDPPDRTAGGRGRVRDVRRPAAAARPDEPASTCRSP